MLLIKKETSWHRRPIAASVPKCLCLQLKAVSEHTQEDRICRSDNQSPSRHTPQCLHVGSHLHSRPTYSLRWWKERRGGRRSGRVRKEREREGREREREREDVTDCFGTLCVSVMPIQHFAANLIEQRRREKWERGSEREGEINERSRKGFTVQTLLSCVVWVQTLWCTAALQGTSWAAGSVTAWWCLCTEKPNLCIWSIFLLCVYITGVQLSKRWLLTETSISDNLVSVITLLCVLGLHLSVPTHTDSVRDFLCGLERLEGLDKKTNVNLKFQAMRVLGFSVI